MMREAGTPLCTFFGIALTNTKGQRASDARAMMMNSRARLVTGVWLILAAVSYLPTPLSAAETGLLKPSDAKLIETGKQVYADNCASCHGENLEGEPNWRRPKPDGKMPAPPHDISGHTWHHTDQVLFDITKFGLKKFAGDDYKSDMPVYDGVLSDDEIIAVLSFIKSTWPSNIRDHHDQINKDAAKTSE